VNGLIKECNTVTLHHKNFNRDGFQSVIVPGAIP
jgi:hypothetical protein